ncbi:hypothetical protein AZE42_09888 [Rhizopogon vesiculosus]|uniref:Uncharacterized protein n=1 Tax=Rhizopogon vesiculosus TaxID=180088 RepID=A0A1J8PWG2_9AGAM|nr:hypothetical protein AZE42_09888 [Rhizopogon vesiculosus]
MAKELSARSGPIDAASCCPAAILLQVSRCTARQILSSAHPINATSYPPHSFPTTYDLSMLQPVSIISVHYIREYEARGKVNVRDMATPAQSLSQIPGNVWVRV